MDFNPQDNPYALMEFDTKLQVMKPEKSFVAGILMCNICGYVLLFNAKRLGL